MSEPFPAQNSSTGRKLSLLLGLTVALGIMLLVPLTQIFQPKGRSIDRIEAVELAPPPPPPPILDLPPPPPKREEPPPELEAPPPMPSLEQLEISLEPGIGSNLGLEIGMGIDLTAGTESVDQLERLFGFGELDEIPRLVREGRFRYPPNAPRGRGEAFVRLLVYVERDGRVAVQQVVDFSHREFIDAATRMAEDSRFSPPTRDGEAVRSQYEWSIRIPLR